MRGLVPLAAIGVLCCGTPAGPSTPSPLPTPAPTPSPPPSPSPTPSPTPTPTPSPSAPLDPRLTPAAGTPARSLGAALDLTIPPDPSAAAPVRLSVADGTTALIRDGEVIVWGDHPDHVPLRVEHVGPVRIAGIDDAIQVAAFPRGVAVLRANGTVIEVAATPRGAERAQPRVPPMRVIAASSGGALCGVTRRGEVHCWHGFQVDGEPLERPRRIPGISTARRVAIQNASGAALLADGTVRSFGDGDPVTLGGAVDVAATAWSTCALMRDGTVQCWGERLDESRDHQATPALVAGLDGAVSIHAGDLLVCARRRDGNVACVGRGVPGFPVATAARVHGSAVVAAMAAGATEIGIAQGHACWLAADGTPRCAGENDAGQLGTLPRRTVVSEVPGIAGATWVSAWSHLACAGGPSGAWCWGSGGAYDLAREAPRPLQLPGIAAARAVWTDGARACLLLPGDVRECFVDVSTTPRSLGRMDGAVEIAASCAGTRDGRVRCGIDTATAIDVSPYRPGSLGARSTYGAQVVCWTTPPSGRTDCVELRIEPDGRPYVIHGGAATPERARTAGTGLVCDLVDGTVECEGFLDVAVLMGRTGEGHPDAPAARIRWPRVTDATAIATGEGHVCALRRGGQVACFSDTRSGGVGAVPAWIHLDPVTPSLPPGGD